MGRKVSQESVKVDHHRSNSFQTNPLSKINVDVHDHRKAHLTQITFISILVTANGFLNPLNTVTQIRRPYAITMSNDDRPHKKPHSMPLKTSPIVITVGPQCAGKTTTLTQSNTTDISIDDQQGIYHPVPLPHFIAPTLITDNITIHDKTLTSRLTDPSQDELRHILQRLTNNISTSRLKDNLLSPSPRQPPISALETLITHVRHFSKHQPLSLENPCTIDLFIPEALFQSPSLGLRHAIDKLNAAALSHDEPIAWGNTNTRPREYETALQAAAQSQRPVTFKLLVAVELEELLKRNVKRLIETGRYINTKSVVDAVGRCRSLMAAAEREKERIFGEEGEGRKRKEGDEEWMLEVALASLAGFHMDEERRVRRVGEVRDLDGRGGGGGRMNGERGRGGRGDGRYQGRSRGGYGRNNYNYGGHGRDGNYTRSEGGGYQDRSRGGNYTQSEGGGYQDRSRDGRGGGRSRYEGRGYTHRSNDRNSRGNRRGGRGGNGGGYRVGGSSSENGGHGGNRYNER